MSRSPKYCMSIAIASKPDRTKALEMDGVVPKEEAQRRLVALQNLQRSLTLGYHRSRVGTRTQILIEGESRRGGGQLRGRDPYHRVVNLASTPVAVPRAGDMLTVDLVEATPHSLIGELEAA